MPADIMSTMVRTVTRPMLMGKFLQMLRRIETQTSAQTTGRMGAAIAPEDGADHA
jgi:hypothetical protein